MSRTSCCLIATAAFVLILAGPTLAQTLGPDEKEIAAHRLTLPTVKKVAAVIQALEEESAQDPRAKELAKIKAEIKELEKKEELTEAEQAKVEKLQERQQTLEDELERSSDDSGDSKSLADMEAQLKKHPSAMRALAREGLTPRQYAVTVMALLQAAMVEGFSQGKADLGKLPPGVNPENIRFVREHKAELEAIYAAMSGKQPK